MKPIGLARAPSLVKGGVGGASTSGSHTVDADVPDRMLGAILVAGGRLADDQVEKILSLQRERGLRFGEAAVELGLASDDDILWALAQQFHYPVDTSTKDTRYPELVTSASPFGEQAEAFRELRSQLMMGALAPTMPRRALAVVSPDVGDGKTFIAANLAVAFSQLGVHTLLIDVDMRTPRQHELFGIGNTGGLSNILSGRSEANVIRPVADLPNLFVLPAGSVPPNPLELVQRPSFATLMRELSLKFDYVLVDTPANSHGADARVVAAACGAVLAVGRQGKSRLRSMHKLISALMHSQTAIAGVVVNDR